MRWLTNLLRRKPQRATRKPIRRTRLELEALKHASCRRSILPPSGRRFRMEAAS